MAKRTPPAAKAKTAKSTKPSPKKKVSAAESRAAESADEVKIDRRRADRRGEAGDEAAGDRAAGDETLTPRKKVNRRRQIDPTTCERDYTDHEVEFMNALDDYKRASGRMFPTCSEVLEVVRSLGYVKLSPAELAARQADEPPVDDASADAEHDSDEAFDSETLEDEDAIAPAMA